MKEYIQELLGKKKAGELHNAMKANKPIIVSGVNGSGKTTLVKALRANGYTAYEDFEVCQINLDKELTKIDKDKLSSIL